MSIQKPGSKFDTLIRLIREADAVQQANEKSEAPPANPKPVDPNAGQFKSRK